MDEANVCRYDRLVYPWAAFLLILLIVAFGIPALRQGKITPDIMLGGSDQRYTTNL